MWKRGLQKSLSGKPPEKTPTLLLKGPDEGAFKDTRAEASQGHEGTGKHMLLARVYVIPSPFHSCYGGSDRGRLSFHENNSNATFHVTVLVGLKSILHRRVHEHFSTEVRWVFPDLLAYFEGKAISFFRFVSLHKAKGRTVH